MSAESISPNRVNSCPEMLGMQEDGRVCTPCRASQLQGARRPSSLLQCMHHGVLPSMINPMISGPPVMPVRIRKCAPHWNTFMHKFRAGSAGSWDDVHKEPIRRLDCDKIDLCAAHAFRAAHLHVQAHTLDRKSVGNADSYLACLQHLHALRDADLWRQAHKSGSATQSCCVIACLSAPQPPSFALLAQINICCAMHATNSSNGQDIHRKYGCTCAEC